LSRVEHLMNAEAEIMKYLWDQNGKPSTSTEIRAALETKQGWSKSTVLTLIRRLVDKKIIACKKRDVFYYTPLVTEEEYQEFQTKNFVGKIYNGSVKNLIASLCHADSLSKEDIQELRELLDRKADEDD
jgi:BlaI family transcriptional regulator, penicillinase repressor